MSYLMPTSEPRISEYKSIDEYIKARHKFNRIYVEYETKVQRDFPELFSSDDICIENIEGMKVKYIGKPDHEDFDCFIQGKIYSVISIESDMYRIIDESGADFLFEDKYFEIIENGHVLKIL